ncbi:MAG: tRNA 2-thiouridine(34) synthase MnmA [Candidatus Omnitrophica bacterium]|nr:tRNA 2-thiouridine(34) synthase MnmA [Candidatus Omnitrophota bacterium]
MKKKILVAMSGGIDSSVAAFLLKEEGYDCIGATIKTWSSDECTRTARKMCCSIDAVGWARETALYLGIPHYVFDLSEAFNKTVREYFYNEYEKSRTPNPCIYCNSEIKFGILLKKADELGCSHIASGHYARVTWDPKKGRFDLMKGADKKKDQSYFLFNLHQGQLGRILFPLGSLTKEKVKNISIENGLKAHERPSSQDICFLDKPRHEITWKIVHSEGRLLGHYKGISNFTVGQRKGLGIAFKEPLYITRIDRLHHTIEVGSKLQVYKRVLRADRFNWLREVILPSRFSAKIRYGQDEALADVDRLDTTDIRIAFAECQNAPTAGQAVVLYDGEYVVGGGWIKSADK